MCLEYTSEKSGLVDALIFKEALCKLIYQTIYKQSYHNAKDQNEINLLCK